MSEARDRIFRAISDAVGPRDRLVAEILAEADALVQDADVYRPTFSGQSNLDRFIEKATSERVTATVERLIALQEVPQAVSRYLDRLSLPAAIALQPRRSLTALDWQGVRTHDAPSPSELVALSIADLAVAETGSVVFLSGADAPTLMNFLPLHHLVVVEAEKIYRHLEDVFVAVGSRPEDQPRNINIVTGTSGTADIEAKNIRGAHGPRFMHIFIV
jgi:L-lactate dehydrogenase complex protein LldG